MKSNTTKYLLIAGVAAVGYYLYTKGGVSSGLTAAGNQARAAIAAYVPTDPVFQSLSEGLTDAQAAALLAWNNAGRPSTGITDQVLGPVLATFKAAGGYFF